MTRISWEHWAALAVSLERLERRSARAAATRGENDLGRLIEPLKHHRAAVDVAMSGGCRGERYCGSPPGDWR
jgi:hypothetical protein